MSTSRRIACVRIPYSPTEAPAGAEPRRCALVGALLRAAPRVTPVHDHPWAWWADASGMERWGGDAGVAQALHRAATEAGFAEARVGVAGTAVAAALATRSAGSPWRVVPAGHDRGFVGLQPLDPLPMSAEVRAALRELGLQRCGELGGLPAAAVELRWGAAGLAAWRLARADDARWPFRPAAPAVASAGTEFEPPITSLEPLRFVLPGLVSSLCTQLEARQRLPAALRIALVLADGSEHSREVCPARPTAHVRLLAELCRRALEDTAVAAPIAELRLSAPREGCARADQLDAFSAPRPDPAALQTAVLPIFTRWGPEALCRAEWHGAHEPAARAGWVPLGRRAIAELADGEAEPRERPPRPELRLGLRRIEPAPEIAVRTRGDGVPVEVDLRAALPAGRGCPPGGLRRVRAAGPERISGEWWDGAWAREYWHVEAPGRWLALLFRDARTDGWFLEGWYD